MSRRRASGAPAELVLTCRACGTTSMVASLRVDDDGDPVLTAREGSVEYSKVEPYELVDGRLVPQRAPEERRRPRKLTIRCGKGHAVDALLAPLVERLATIPPGKRRRHAV